MHVYCIHEDVSIYYLYFVKDFTRFFYSFFIDGRSSDISPIRFKPRLCIWHFSTYNMQKYIYMLEHWLDWIKIRSSGCDVRPFLAKYRLIKTCINIIFQLLFFAIFVLNYNPVSFDIS